MNKTVEPTHCFHCGLPVDKNLNIVVEYQNEDKPMCCYGCQAVSQAIIDSGMDDFYKYRTSTSDRPEAIVPEFLQQLKAYDSSAVQKRFVNETDTKDILEVSLILEGITCAACVWLNEQHLNALDGVLSTSINYSNHRARVRWDNSKIQLSDILESISRILTHWLSGTSLRSRAIPAHPGKGTQAADKAPGSVRFARHADHDLRSRHVYRRMVGHRRDL